MTGTSARVSAGRHWRRPAPPTTTDGQNLVISKYFIERLRASGKNVLRRSMRRYRDADSMRPILTAAWGIYYQPMLRVAAPLEVVG